MAKTAILFPGQGAQHVGMGRDIAEASDAAAKVFEQADQQLGIALSELCFNGPAERLDATDISQPAIFVTSVAIWEALRANGVAEGHSPSGAAGLSLGEYTALWLGGSLGFADGLRLVRRRGEMMQAASEATPSSMVSIMGLDEQQVEALCREVAGEDVLVPANFNCPGQIVVSGSKQACERAVASVAGQGGRAMALAVAGAFHSPLMQSAADGLGQALSEAQIESPRMPVCRNVDGEYHDQPDSIRQSLYNQVIQPVRWQRCMERMIADGYDHFVEIGPGRVLTGLMKKINRKVKITNISSAKDVSG
ncbi:MAG TPA: ACP S-malonyltransferase [Phycisphaerae bacterium]|nr:ACP S-malonyltransferase [Phycisphaerae bacterium]